MKVAFFDTHRFEREVFTAENEGLGGAHKISFFESRLNRETALLARGCSAVCAFVNDCLDEGAVRALSAEGIKLIALRSAGYNHVDLCVSRRLGIKIAHVPAYSPHAVAEHAVALLLTLNRKIHRSYNRVKELNFSLEGLVGFDLLGKTAGVLGTGRIGSVLARILSGFGCRILAYDPVKNEGLCSELGVQYVGLEALYHSSDILFLQLPLNEQTRHIVNAESIARMKPGVFIINTGRGALIDTKALIEGLKEGRIGGAGLDVYEEEEGIFFLDLSDRVLQDDVLARLLTFPNVIVTAHQAFLTKEALKNIAQTTLRNIADFEQGRPLVNEVRCGKPRCEDCLQRFGEGQAPKE